MGLRVLMGVIRDKKSGVYSARKKVPDALRPIVGKSWLKESLGTKELAEANRRGKSVLMRFDSIIDGAKAQIAPPKLTPKLSLAPKEIEQLIGYYRNLKLANHAGRWLKLTEEDQDGTELAYADEWREAQAALAAGRLEYIRDEAQKLLVTFGWRLDAASPSWDAVLHRLLQEHVFVYREMAQGELDAIPRVPTVAEVKPPEQPKLSDALSGWKRSKNARPRSVKAVT
jgi:hypothetical protein